MTFAAKEKIPWLMPLLWVGFFAALLVVDAIIKRLGALIVATGGLLLTALGSYAAADAGSLEVLILMQLLTGVGWAAAFADLLEQACAFGTRGAEGQFMGSFFSVLAISSFARIGFVSQLLPQNPALKDMQFMLPMSFLVLAGLLAAVYAFKKPRSPGELASG